MYDIVKNIISYHGSSSNIDSYIIYISCALVLILTIVFIDMVYRVFSSFWR